MVRDFEKILHLHLHQSYNITNFTYKHNDTVKLDKIAKLIPYINEAARVLEIAGNPFSCLKFLG